VFKSSSWTEPFLPSHLSYITRKISSLKNRLIYLSEYAVGTDCRTHRSIYKHPMRLFHYCTFLIASVVLFDEIHCKYIYIWVQINISDFWLQNFEQIWAQFEAFLNLYMRNIRLLVSFLLLKKSEKQKSPFALYLISSLSNVKGVMN